MKVNPGKPVIGLLGGIGAGKSTVAAELARLGCPVIDADALGHQLLKHPQVKAKLRRLWGEGVFDGAGEVDRQALAEAAFASPRGLARLNAVMHPRIRRAIMERLKGLSRARASRAIVLDAALLLETDWHRFCTHLVFVSASRQVRCRRAARARGWDPTTWRRREKTQKPLDIKAARADHVIDNSSSLRSLRQQVRSVFHRIVRSAECP
jgi:dephospho-CoA kinase